MQLRRLVILFLVGAAACSPAEEAPLPPQTVAYGSVAGRIAALAGREPLDYSDAAHWGCSPFTNDDVCDTPIALAAEVTDGTITFGEHAFLADPIADCFYVYPTVDLQTRAENHDNINNVVLPRGVIALQAAPFGAACRVFAPFYRQASIGAYAERPDRAVPIFLNALSDVAAAFEHYLTHWNQGRPIVILGHSQGAQMASYLLHSYFDGVSEITRIAGSETSEKLRERLVAAIPLGFSVFVPQGKKVGGSFSDLPLCKQPDEPGCVITYRTYTEGASFFGRSFGADIDAEMAELGLLNRAMGPGDSLACVNPATGPRLAPKAATDANGAAVRPGDIRLLLGTWNLSYPFQDAMLLPGRYAATCRDNIYGGGYLAISLHDPAPHVDQRGDPLGIAGSANSAMGLHHLDFHLPMGDLIELIRKKTGAFR